ncbi:uncharacterized protein [Musca autumnalis]|uniref:uncharacterized protein n=1 Tax=Musca autumnalis TaxID=221902 RepID=UPI003CEEEBCD
MARSLSTYLNRNVDNEQYYPAPHQSQSSHHHAHEHQQQQQQLLHQSSSLAGQCQRHKATELSVSFANRNENHGPHATRQEYHHQPLATVTTSSNHQQHQQQQQQQYQNITTNPNWLAAPTTNKRLQPEIDDYRETTTTSSLQRPESHQISQQLGYNGSSVAQQALPYCTKHPENFLNTSPGNDIGERVALGGGAAAGNYVAKKTYITPFDIPSPPPQPAEHKRFSSGQYVAKATCSAPGEPTTLSGSNSISNIKSYCQCEHNTRAGKTSSGNNTAAHANHNHFQQQQQQQQPQTQTHQRTISSVSNSNNANNLTAATTPHRQQQTPQYRNHHHSHHYIDEPLTRTPSLKHNSQHSLHHHQQQHQQQQHHHQHQHQHYHQQQPQYRKIDVFAAADDDDNDTSPSIKVRAKRVANFCNLSRPPIYTLMSFS